MIRVLMMATASSGKIKVELPDDFTVLAPTIDPMDAYSDVFFENDGDVSGSIDNDASRSIVGAWVNKKAGLDPSLFEVQAAIISGTLDRGTAGSWLNLASTRNWGITQTVLGTKTTIIDIRVREIADHSNTDVVRVTLISEVSI